MRYCQNTSGNVSTSCKREAVAIFRGGMNQLQGAVTLGNVSCNLSRTGDRKGLGR
jgi:hypothetical protein